MFDQLEETLRSAEEAMAGLDPETLIGTQPSVGIDLLIRHERATAAARLAMVARAEEMHPWQREGYRRFEDWLAAKEGTSHGQARKKARTARKLRDRDKTADALADGDISEDEADVIADAADKNPDAEEELLDTAKNKGRSHDDLKRKAADAKASGEDDKARADRFRRGRRAGWGVDREGFWTLHGRFQPEVGAEIKAHLAAEVDRIFNAARQSGTRESHDRYRADAVVNLIRGARSGSPSPTGTTSISATATGEGASPRDPRRTAPGSTDPGGCDPAGEADRGSGQLDLDLGPGPHPAGPGPGPRQGPVSSAAVDESHGRPERDPAPKELILDINLEALRRGCINPGETCNIRGVGQVPVEVARQWVDDAFIKAVIRDGSDVKRVVHHGRHIPAHVKTALDLLDTTCSVPGCSNPRMEYDHKKRHTDGGGCSTGNLRPLCVHHHRQRTHDGYELVGPHGDRRWVDPDGRVLFADNPQRLTTKPDRVP
jgi:hypothetical protein